MGGIGDAITEGFIRFVLVVIAATVAITAGLIFGIPWAWGCIKPWLHAITG